MAMYNEWECECEWTVSGIYAYVCIYTLDCYVWKVQKYFSTHTNNRMHERLNIFWPIKHAFLGNAYMLCIYVCVRVCLYAYEYDGEWMFAPNVGLWHL